MGRAVSYPLQTIICIFGELCKLDIILLALIIFQVLFQVLGFPGDSVVKKSASQCRRCRRFGLDPWVRKIPWKGIWQPTPVFVSKNLMNRGTRQAIVLGVTKSWLSDWVHISIILSRWVGVPFVYLLAFGVWSETFISEDHQWAIRAIYLLIVHLDERKTKRKSE